ncbi:SGNH/GDSL hydrolase family protein [Bacillus sp. IITD106]|nr:SGNH/GDSL hydrolase family protein [Bacillus sp. IITD106]
MKKNNRTLLVSLFCACLLVISFIFWNNKMPDNHFKVNAATNNSNGVNGQKISVILLGDSNTAISYFNETPTKKWANIIEKELNIKVTNFGIGGRSTSDFLTSGKREKTKGRWVGEGWKKADGDYYIICFGLNDSKYYNENTFEKYTRELITMIQNELKGIPILMTNVYVPYPDHFSFDRNKVIDSFDNIKRKLATELNLDIIDVHDRFKKEWKDNGIWDTRIRTSKIWGAAEDEGKTVDEGWFDNIHYNELGNKIVAEEIIKYFQENIIGQ